MDMEDVDWARKFLSPPNRLKFGDLDQICAHKILVQYETYEHCEESCDCEGVGICVNCERGMQECVKTGLRLANG